MRPRFQADADLNHKILLGLRRREAAIDFQSAVQGGIIGKTDPEVLSVAANAGRILVSHDRATSLVTLRDSRQKTSAPDSLSFRRTPI
jgi:hypothetical protein